MPQAHPLGHCPRFLLLAAIFSFSLAVAEEPAKKAEPSQSVTRSTAHTPVVDDSDNEPIFSGPQPGERLVPFAARQGLGDRAGEEVDVIADTSEAPVLLLFIHEMNRPSIGVLRTIAAYAARVGSRNLRTWVVFLSDDATEMASALQRARHALPTQLPIVVSSDGKEGPGAYGLNRSVTMTIVVGKQGEVMANFALVQPSEKVDVPKVVAAIAKAVGDEHAPSLAELLADQMITDESLRKALALVLAKGTHDERIEPLLAAVREQVRDRPPLRESLSQWSARVVAGTLLEEIPHAKARKEIRRWAESARETGRGGPPELETRLRELLRPMIRKDASEEQVERAVAIIEAAMEKDKQVRGEVIRRSRRIVEAGVLENYGGPRAQAQLRRWSRLEE